MQSFRIVPSIEGLDYFNAEAQSRREAQSGFTCVRMRLFHFRNADVGVDHK